MNLLEEYNNLKDRPKLKLEKMSWEDPQVYKNWLSQTYFFVCHSTRLLALAAGNCSLDFQGLHLRFVKHAGEESRHENLLLRDLEGLNSSIDEFIELSETSNFYQTQYYQIEHINPVAFFGYILVLEGLAVEVGGKIFEKVRACYGKNSNSFLRVHSNEDPDHMKKAWDSISTMNSESQLIILRNLRLSFSNYVQILEAIEQCQFSQKAA